MRKVISLNKGWMFHKGDIEVNYPVNDDKGPVYSQSKTIRKHTGPAAYGYYDAFNPYYRFKDIDMRSGNWKHVNVPHDYIIGQTPTEEGNCATGYFIYDNAWYRKHFEPDQEWKGKRVILQFGGIAGDATIYLNGCLMKHNFSAFNEFDVDITDNIYFDRENVLAIYVFGKRFEGWWYQGAGIYRNVNLVVTEPVALDRYGVYAPATKVNDKLWRVDFQSTVVNDYDEDKNIAVESDIVDVDGTVVATAKAEGKAEFRSKTTLKYLAEVNDPKIWDTETPNLYKVVTRVYVDGVLSDEDYTRIGFRTIAVDAKDGFILNGRKVLIKGVCMHQDFGLTGLVLPDNVAKYKLDLIKQMGSNGVRLCHYMHCERTMDLLDEMGMIVFDETRWFESTEESLEQLRVLVMRDRNRPSVVFWSTGNEEYYQKTAEGPRIHKRMAALIRKLDNTRFITSAQSNDPHLSTVFPYCDVISINYNHRFYDEVHEMYPDKPVLSSENCATGTTRDWLIESNNYGRVRDKDRDTNHWFLGREKNWKFFTERSYIMGGYQWDSIEHRGEAVWPQLCSKSGAIDLFLQKKGAFYQNVSHWTDEPMAHIVPHWNLKGLEGEEVVVTVYTNCEELELYLNGVSLGKQEIEKYGHGEWNVAYEPGELKVIGRKGGKDVVEHVRKTTKKPYRLVLRQDLKFKADGSEVGLFTCECVDEDGLVVPNASPFVKFSVNEEFEIVGTGSDNCDHNKVTLPERKMYEGKITIAVRSKGEAVASSSVSAPLTVLPTPKEMKLYAMNDDLGMAVIKVDIEK